MRNEVKIVLIVAVSVAVGVLGAWLLMPPAADVTAEHAAKERKLARSVRSGSVKKITEISVGREGGKKSVRIVESEETRPDVVKSAEIDDEELLSPVQKSVLEDIQRALDADDVKALRKALSRFTASTSRGGLGGYANVPRVIRSAAVQALGWFGRDAAVDLVDFMADADEEISSDAFDQFEQALQDVDMGDAERASIVRATARALTDSDHIDMLLTSLNDMRNSVKGETVIAILAEGTDQAKAMMLEQMDAYLDEGIATENDVRKWMAENPDDSDDEEIYGGCKE